MLLLSTTILAVDATLSLIFLLAFGPLIDTVTYGECDPSKSRLSAFIWSDRSQRRNGGLHGDPVPCIPH